MNIILPAMGEGVIEATINKWLVSEGSLVNEDDPVVEVATDKVDSEIPSPASGKLVSIIAKEGSIARIGDIVAIIEIEVVTSEEESRMVDTEVKRIRETIESVRQEKKEVETASQIIKSRTPSGKFLSPLVRSMALREGISHEELDKTSGTGMDGRITRDDLLKMVDKRKLLTTEEKQGPVTLPKEIPPIKISVSVEDEIIPMDRVRRLISDHMVMSKKTSPHVTSFIDADVTRLINWRNSVKDKFFATEGQKLTSLLFLSMLLPGPCTNIQWLTFLLTAQILSGRKT